ncbi:hypothetical protein CTKZ_16900 [Cellulomonas algicola]|uniref:Low molecular weight protein antigen 6 PH domain-containing protein n=1 Tax=Cellulomonas algicola TaxID=2071633 RepID=A0A401UZL1_9CELL|nr:PH domain-containing protein [Cellulomonas algicola]GCD20128.1 hypothetical protein CTKZ_16900 [Cellulomonas algicola]
MSALATSIAVLGVLLGLATVSLGASGATDASGVLLGVGALVTVLAHVLGLRPRVAATQDGIVVRNPWHTIRIPWAEVAGFEGGARMSVRLRSGDDVACWAVQKTNLYLVLDRPGRPERMSQRFATVRPTTPPGPARGATGRGVAVPWVPVATVVVVALVTVLLE